jgi:diadenosine tetraphosphatase ApaH/serine/threonine PP2A family protein phosphatase
MSLDVDQALLDLETGQEVPEAVVIQSLTKVKDCFFQENTLLELSAPVTICGDIHGQFPDLLQLFACAGGAPDQTFLFMGDYVDRGDYSLRTLVYLALRKLRAPGRVFMLRGNHESREVSRTYGFQTEILVRFGHLGIWDLANEVFDLLPLAALIGGVVFSVQGGLSPSLPRVEEIVAIDRAAEIPPEGPVADLCWSDPDDAASSWRKNSRGAGFVFGRNQVAEFCHVNGGLRLITRSHQIAERGVRWYFDNRLVVVWSAPNYYRKNDQRNPGAVLKYAGPNSMQVLSFEARQGKALWNAPQ